jgi:hypothetical protein
VDSRQRNATRVESLLPWYLNGSLGAAETDEVNAAVDQAPDLKQQLADEIALSQRLQAEPPGLAEVMQRRDRAFFDLLAKIDRRVARRRPTLPPTPPPDAVPALSATWRKGLLAGAGAFIALAVGMSVWFEPNTPTAPPAVNSTPSSQPVRDVHVEVVSTSSTGDYAVTELLREQNGIVLRGPDHRGVYHLVLPESGAVNARLAQLRGTDGISRVDVRSAPAER